MDVAKWFYLATLPFILFESCAGLSNIEELHDLMDEYIAPRFAVLQQRIKVLESGKYEMEKKIKDLQHENNELRQHVNLNNKELNFLKQKLNIESDPINLNLDEITQPSSYNKSRDGQRKTSTIQRMNKVSRRNRNSYASRLLKRDSTVPVSPKVIAFSATFLARVIDTFRVNDILKFDKLFINEGGRYDKLFGLFTCDEKGAYFFTWTVTSWEGHHVETKIVRNNILGGRNDAFGSKQGSGSNTVILNLEVGDRVWIVISQLVPTDSKVFGDYTTFSGFHLK